HLFLLPVESRSVTQRRQTSNIHWKCHPKSPRAESTTTGGAAHATSALDDCGTVPAVGRRDPDQRNHQAEHAGNHQYVAHDVPVDVGRVKVDCEPENRA